VVTLNMLLEFEFAQAGMFGFTKKIGKLALIWFLSLFFKMNFDCCLDSESRK
jgi:hypothetical protein